MQDKIAQKAKIALIYYILSELRNSNFCVNQRNICVNLLGLSRKTLITTLVYAENWCFVIQGI